MQCPDMGYNGIMPIERKLNDDQVRYVRTTPKSSLQLADELPVDRKAIDRVRQRKTYKDVPDAPPGGGSSAALSRNDYVVGDALELMSGLPDGYAETVVTMPPEFRPPHASQPQVRKARSSYFDLQRSIIRESRRIAGPRGVLLYVHRYDLMADLLDVGPGGISEFHPEQVIVWDTMTRADPSPDSIRRIPGQHLAIYVFAGSRWRIPPEIKDGVRRLGDVWRFKANLRDGGALEMPDPLTDLLISMGPGRVLDPFAGVGHVGLAAVRKNRDWTLFGKSAQDQRTFRQRQQAFIRERAMTPTVQSMGSRRRSRSSGRARGGSGSVPKNQTPLL